MTLKEILLVLILICVFNMCDRLTYIRNEINAQHETIKEQNKLIKEQNGYLRHIKQK